LCSSRKKKIATNNNLLANDVVVSLAITISVSDEGVADTGRDLNYQSIRDETLIDEIS